MDFALHIGAHRTGTTALQQSVRRARGVLARGGVEVWGPPEMRKPRFAAFARNHATRDDPSKLIRAAHAQEEMRSCFARLAKQGRMLLFISEENLPGTMEGNFAETALYPIAHKNLRARAALFPKPPTRLFYAIRDYAGYWASAYAFCRLQEVQPPAFDTSALVASSLARGWVDVLADVRGAFPESRILVWRHSPERSALTTALAAILGETLARDIAIQDQPANASLSAEAITEYQAARARKGAPFSPQERRAVVTALRARKGTPFAPFNADERAALDRRFADDWKRLQDGAVAGVELLQAADRTVPR